MKRKSWQYSQQILKHRQHSAALRRRVLRRRLLSRRDPFVRRLRRGQHLLWLTGSRRQIRLPQHQQHLRDPQHQQHLRDPQRPQLREHLLRSSRDRFLPQLREPLLLRQLRDPQHPLQRQAQDLFLRQRQQRQDRCLTQLRDRQRPSRDPYLLREDPHLRPLRLQPLRPHRKLPLRTQKTDFRRSARRWI